MTGSDKNTEKLQADFPYKTCIFDISGVITDANLTFTKKIWTCMLYADISKYDVGFEEMILAFGANRMSNVFEEKNVPKEKRDIFWETWKRIPEHVPGDIRLFPDVIPTLNTLQILGVKVVLASRLYGENFDLVIYELQMIGKLKVEIIRASPESQEERMRDDCMQRVLARAIDNTRPPRIYVDDSLGRMKGAKSIDPDISCIGSTHGFFNETQLKNAGADRVICNLSELFK